MAHNSIFGPDPARPGPSKADRHEENGALLPAVWTAGESDLGELAAKFAAHGGGRVSRELSADLALEVVLNEIVEQACLATRASGAALVLERGGEWVCRASAGGHAPQLGARLNTASGLSGACVMTRTVQRCDDAQNDPRADVEACRILGVRSVIILPLLQNGDLVGVLEAFSTLPSAFGERDERTLEALSQRVLRNLQRASKPICAGAEPSKGVQPTTESHASSSVASGAASDGKHSLLDRPLLQPASEAAPVRRANLMTLALSAAVLAYAVLLTVLVVQRLSGRKAVARARPPAAVAAPLTPAASQAAGAGGSAPSRTSGEQSAGSKSSTTQSANRSAGPPAGGLLVYENGKEVFRMNPAAEQGEATSAGGTNPSDVTSARGTEVKRASAVEPAAIIELPAEVAEGSLLHRVEPDYPEEARQQQIQGAVVLDLHIGQDGSVQQVKVVSGPPLLVKAATAAVKQWRFQPGLVSGRPAEMQTRITLNFRLPQ
jgi:TonB family protein